MKFVASTYIGCLAAGLVFALVPGNASAQQPTDNPVMQIFWQQIQAQDPYFNTAAVPARNSAPAPQPAPATYRQPVAAATPVAQTAQTQGTLGAAPSTGPLWGSISELRFGVLAHDILFPSRHRFHVPNPTNHRYESGQNLNPEVVFVAPDILKYIGSPRPHIGATINTVGDTSSVYGGFGWDARWDSVFLEGFLGLAVHDGKTRGGNPERIDFGSPVLFRLGGELGWRFKSGHGASVIWEHMSHADMFSNKNQGIDSLGVRYSYFFSD